MTFLHLGALEDDLVTDQDILERLVCLWPTTRSNRAKLTCQGRGAELGFGLAIFILAELSPLIFLCRSKSFLGPVKSLKEARVELKTLWLKKF